MRIVLFLVCILLFIGQASASYLQVQNGTTVQFSNITEFTCSVNPCYINVTLPSNISGTFQYGFQAKYVTAAPNIQLMKDSIGLGTNFYVNNLSYVQYNETITNFTNSTQLNLKISGIGQSKVQNFMIMYSYVPAPTILFPSNNSAQTSRIVNITTNATIPIQYQVSQSPIFTTLIYNTTTSNNYSGNLTLPTGLNYIRVRGYNSTEDSVTNWTQVQIIIYSSVYMIGGQSYNWSANWSMSNVFANLGDNYVEWALWSNDFDNNVIPAWTQKSGVGASWNYSNGKLIQNNATATDIHIFFNNTNFSDFDMLASSKYYGSGSYPLWGYDFRTTTWGVANTARYGYEAWTKAGGNPNTLRVDMGLSGGSIVMGVDNITTVVSNNTYYTTRILANGSTLKYKIWQGSTSSEPFYWNREVTNTSQTHGEIGLISHTTANEWDYIWIRPVNLNGSLNTTGNLSSVTFDLGSSQRLNVIKFNGTGSNMSLYLQTSPNGTIFSDEVLIGSDLVDDTYYSVPDDNKKQYYKIRLQYNTTLNPNTNYRKVKQFEVFDTDLSDSHPNYSQLSSTWHHVAGSSIIHSSYWNSSSIWNMSGYIFSYDNGSGTYVNDSYVYLSPQNNLTWINVTKTANSTIGSTIRWKVYANDVLDNWNVTEEQSYVTQQYAVYDLNNGAYISSDNTSGTVVLNNLKFNFTITYQDGYNNPLETYTHIVNFTSTTNKTILNMTKGNDYFNFTLSGISGYLNYSSFMLNSAQNYSFFANNSQYDKSTNTLSGEAASNYLLDGSTKNMSVQYSEERIIQVNTPGASTAVYSPAVVRNSTGSDIMYYCRNSEGYDRIWSQNRISSGLGNSSGWSTPIIVLTPEDAEVGSQEDAAVCDPAALIDGDNITHLYYTAVGDPANFTGYNNTVHHAYSTNGINFTRMGEVNISGLPNFYDPNAFGMGEPSIFNDSGLLRLYFLANTVLSDSMVYLAEGTDGHNFTYINNNGIGIIAGHPEVKKYGNKYIAVFDKQFNTIGYRVSSNPQDFRSDTSHWFLYRSGGYAGDNSTLWSPTILIDEQILYYGASNVTIPAQLGAQAMIMGVKIHLDFIAPPPPYVNTYNPSTPNTSGLSGRQFSVSFTNAVNTITWYINDTQVQQNLSVTSANYTNTSAVTGFYIVNATACNTEGCATQLWNWTVDGTPPASITNLQNSTTTTSINWTWTDPIDTDFSHVMIYMNGTWLTNVTAGTQYYQNSSLTPNTWYELGTHTVDTVDNINQTWVNQTTRTAVEVTTFNQSIYNTGWQTIFINATQNMTTIRSMMNISNVLWIAKWNATSQKFETYKAGWTIRATNNVSLGEAVYLKVTNNDTVTRNNGTGNYNWTTKIGWNMLGLDYNGSRTLTQINTSINLNGGCIADNISYINFSTQTESLFTCGNVGNASVLVNQGEGFFVNSTNVIDISRSW